MAVFFYGNSKAFSLLGTGAQRISEHATKSADIREDDRETTVICVLMEGPAASFVLDVCKVAGRYIHIIADILAGLSFCRSCRFYRFPERCKVV